VCVCVCVRVCVCVCVFVCVREYAFVILKHVSVLCLWKSSISLVLFCQRDRAIERAYKALPPNVFVCVCVCKCVSVCVCVCACAVHQKSPYPLQVVAVFYRVLQCFTGCCKVIKVLESSAGCRMLQRAAGCCSCCSTTQGSIIVFRSVHANGGS